MNELKTVSMFYRSVVGFTPHPSDELLLGYVEERVNLREKNRIEAHLEACSQCREDFQMLQQFANTIPSAPSPTLVMTEVKEEPETLDSPPPLRLSVAPPLEVPSAPEPVPMPEKIAPPPPPKTPRRAPAKPEEPVARPRQTLLIASLFLGVNALGLGAIYGTLSRRAPSRTTATPAPTVAESAPKPAGSVAVIQAAYERRLAQDQGKIAALEKQVQALRKAPAPSAQAKSPVGERLLDPGGLTLDKGGSRSLSVHPTITWKPAARAHHYAVELTDASGKSVVKTQLRREEWRVAAALLRGETYRWSATPQDRDNQPLGETRTGDVTVASEEDATKLSDQLKTLATELERLGFSADATALKESAETVLKK